MENLNESETTSIHSATLTERFNRIPQMQLERQREYEDQFTSANNIAKRLTTTRLEAERVAQLEIERTKRMMEDAVRQHPDFLQFQRDLNEAQMRVTKWEHEHQSEKNRTESELNALKGQEKDEAQRLDAAIGREAEFAKERERLSRDLESARIQMETLKGNLDVVATEEESCSASTSPIRSQIDQIRSTINSLGPKRTSMEGELESARRRLNELESNVVAENHRYTSSLEQINQLRAKLGEAQMDLTAAQENETSANALLQSHKNEIEFFREQINNYSQRRSQHLEIENEFKELLKQAEGLRGRLSARRQEFTIVIENLNNRKSQIRQEIDRLVREEADIMSQVEQNRAKLDTIPDEEVRLISDITQIQQNLDSACSATKDLDNNFKGYRDTLADYDKRLPGIEKSQSDAKNEVSKANELINQFTSQISAIERTTTDYYDFTQKMQTQIGSTKNLIDALSSDLSSVNYNLEENERKLKELEQEFSSIQARWGEVRSRRSQAEKEYNEAKRNYEEINRRYSGIPFQTDSGRLNEHLLKLRGQITELESKLFVFPSTNPHKGELETLQRRATEIRNQVWERVQSNPPQHLRDQLAREAEAVMRAEATASLEKKQSEIVRETEDLARRKLLSAPRLEVDNEASQVLLNELMEPRSRRNVFETVLNMCDQKHIRSASSSQTT